MKHSIPEKDDQTKALLHAKLPELLLRQLRSRAALRGILMRDAVSEAIAEWLERQKKQGGAAA